MPMAAYEGELEKWLRLLRAQRERQDRQQPKHADASISSKHDAVARFIRVLPSISQLPSITLRVLVDELRKRQTPSSSSGPTPARSLEAEQSADADQSFRDDIMYVVTTQLALKCTRGY